MTCASCDRPIIDGEARATLSFDLPAADRVTHPLTVHPRCIRFVPTPAAKPRVSTLPDRRQATPA